MVTWGGDANLDGKINIDDYGQIDFNVGSGGLVFGWFNGDFNYDGVIDATDYGINQAGFVIHSAIHKARHDVDCIIHTHTLAGMAVSAMKCGLLPLPQDGVLRRQRDGRRGDERECQSEEAHRRIPSASR